MPDPFRRIPKPTHHPHGTVRASTARANSFVPACIIAATLLLVSGCCCATNDQPTHATRPAALTVAHLVAHGGAAHDDNTVVFESLTLPEACRILRINVDDIHVSLGNPPDVDGRYVVTDQFTALFDAELGSFSNIGFGSDEETTPAEPGNPRDYRVRVRLKGDGHPTARPEAQ